MATLDISVGGKLFVVSIVRRWGSPIVGCRIYI
jgi:hypothetical protein